MKRILVPTDFSPNALSALRIAADIALRNKGTVILYHVYTPAKRTVIADKIEREQYNIQAETIILKRLQRVKKTVLKDVSGITISTIIGRSPLLNNILGFAEHNYIDMIVMGTKGASGIKKVFIGSVAAKDCTKCRCTCFTDTGKIQACRIRLYSFCFGFSCIRSECLII